VKFNLPLLGGGSFSHLLSQISARKKKGREGSEIRGGIEENGGSPKKGESQEKSGFSMSTAPLGVAV